MTECLYAIHSPQLDWLSLSDPSRTENEKFVKFGFSEDLDARIECFNTPVDPRVSRRLGCYKYDCLLGFPDWTLISQALLPVRYGRAQAEAVEDVLFAALGNGFPGIRHEGLNEYDRNEYDSWNAYTERLHGIGCRIDVSRYSYSLNGATEVMPVTTAQLRRAMEAVAMAAPEKLEAEARRQVEHLLDAVLKHLTVPVQPTEVRVQQNPKFRRIKASWIPVDQVLPSPASYIEPPEQSPYPDELDDDLESQMIAAEEESLQELQQEFDQEVERQRRKLVR